MRAYCGYWIRASPCDRPKYHGVGVYGLYGLNGTRHRVIGELEGRLDRGWNIEILHLLRNRRVAAGAGVALLHVTLLLALLRGVAIARGIVSGVGRIDRAAVAAAA
jgi:hypothetical protein